MDDEDEPRIKLKDMTPVERRRILKRMAADLGERAKRRISLGWQCPACQRVYGPRARECWVCNKGKPMSDFEERLAKLELQVEMNASAALTIVGMQRDRLNVAQERIAALERKVAALEAPGPPSLDDPDFYGKLDAYLRARNLGQPTPLPKKPCATCGAVPTDSFTTPQGHFLVNDGPCPEEPK